MDGQHDPPGMQRRSTPGKKDLEEDEKEIGKNIPEEMKGLDTEDVGDPTEGGGEK